MESETVREGKESYPSIFALHKATETVGFNHTTFLAKQVVTFWKAEHALRTWSGSRSSCGPDRSSGCGTCSSGWTGLYCSWNRGGLCWSLYDVCCCNDWDRHECCWRAAVNWCRWPLWFNLCCSYCSGQHSPWTSFVKLDWPVNCSSLNNHIDLFVQLQLTHF
ncbi:hypothetical protein RRG08_025302 [Elysia crispata]|uniref:Uncharacterized protein n=1 Tax=Elysia crispata TaxID=231223 RepID=A0AAE1A9W9_9GAST|nr:hypothetical protein RRG08_025302 [Elysia crispata]